MRHRVTLESQSVLIGDGGRKTVTYPAIATVWAAIEPKAQSPVVRGDQLDFPVTQQITVRYAANYTAARRITLSSRVFWVRAVINPGALDEYLIFNTEEGAVASV